MARFQKHEATYTSLAGGYSEAQARTDFITPFWAALGWDVANERGLPEDLREVIQEPSLAVENATKRPDYELRLARQRKFFVEAKRPGIRIELDKPSAFQTRRYGFSGGVPIAILTNFATLAVYDSSAPPYETDEPSRHRRALYRYEEYVSSFDSLYDRFSREAVGSGGFDAAFSSGLTWRRATQFDEFFLAQVRRWREMIAVDVSARTTEIPGDVLTFGISRLITRLVFLRICEDRGIESPEGLKKIVLNDPVEALRGVLSWAHEKYDSGLFRDREVDLPMSPEVLRTIVAELYYPNSPYTFAVVEPAILGEIYEMLLGEEVSIVGVGRVATKHKPEVVAAGGVVATPLFIVEAILDRTVRELIGGRSPEELKDFTVADIACGSGVFLVGAYGALLSHYLDWYVADGPESHEGKEIARDAAGGWRLEFAERREILTRHIYGVDVDPQAVEVASFSLLLELIENESAASIDSFARKHREPVLPDLGRNIISGNSLVAPQEVLQTFGSHAQDVFMKINPLDWQTVEPVRRGGFDAIVGNPPYVRIQNIVGWAKEELALYRNAFATARSDNFDKYSLFVERSLGLLKENGRVGWIVPNKFFITTAGAALRKLLSDGGHIAEIVDFGALQVFGERASNYTCILTLAREPREALTFTRVTDLNEWVRSRHGESRIVRSSELTSEKWSFANEAALALFERVRLAHPATLADVADIFVGVQTSADDIYVVHPTRADEQFVEFTDSRGIRRRIERAITRPALRDAPLELYVPPRPNAAILWPYTIENERAVPIPEELLRQQYPHAWEYLHAFEPELRKRNIVGGTSATRTWYQFGRSQSLTKMDGPKIILPILSTEPRYVLDTENLVVTGGGNGPYYLVRPVENSNYSVEFLLAVLAHPLSEAIVRSRPSVFRGGYYSHGKQFIAPLPVPSVDCSAHDEITSEVRTLIAATVPPPRATPQALEVQRRYVDALRASIERRVSALFGVSERDLAIAASVTVPAE